MENSKNYVVVAAHCNVAHRATRLKRGDVKPASYFEVEQLRRLIQGGYLAEHTALAGEPNDPPAGEPNDPPAGEPSDPPAGEPSDPPAGEPSDPPAGEPSDPPAGEPTKFDAEKATVSELKIELTKLNIPFTASALKADLVKAYTDSFLN